MEEDKIIDVIEELKKNDLVVVFTNNGIVVYGKVDDICYTSSIEFGDHYRLRLRLQDNLPIEFDAGDIYKIKHIPTDEEGNVVTTNALEDYGIPADLEGKELVMYLTDNWDDFDDEEKEEITEIINPMITNDLLADIIGTISTLKKYNAEQHEKIMDLLDEKEAELEKKPAPSLTGLDVLVGGTLGVIALLSSLGD